MSVRTRPTAVDAQEHGRGTNLSQAHDASEVGRGCGEHDSEQCVAPCVVLVCGTWEVSNRKVRFLFKKMLLHEVKKRARFRKRAPLFVYTDPRDSGTHSTRTSTNDPSSEIPGRID